MNPITTNQTTNRLVKLGMLTALSILLVFLIHFPIFPSAAYLLEIHFLLQS